MVNARRALFRASAPEGHLPDCWQYSSSTGVQANKREALKVFHAKPLNACEANASEDHLES